MAPLDIGIGVGGRRRPGRRAGGAVDNAINLLGDGNDFVTGWTAVGVTVTANQSNDANGDPVADLLTNTNDGTNKRIFKSITCADGEVHNASVVVEAGTEDAVQLNVFTAGFASQILNLTYDIGTDTFTTGSGVATDLGGGLYRISGTFTASGTTHIVMHRVGAVLGTAAATAYLSQGQVTQGADLLPYRSS
jgi:hypothetical protein